MRLYDEEEVSMRIIDISRCAIFVPNKQNLYGTPTYKHRTSTRATSGSGTITREV